jgi:hypothetical protein
LTRFIDFQQPFIRPFRSTELSSTAFENAMPLGETWGAAGETGITTADVLSKKKSSVYKNNIMSGLS